MGDGGWVGSQKFSNLNLGWVKSMPGDFGECTVNIGLGVNFLVGGTFFKIETTPCHIQKN